MIFGIIFDNFKNIKKIFSINFFIIKNNKYILQGILLKGLNAVYF